MGWATTRTAEMPTVPAPAGRHRRHRSAARIAAALLLVGLGVTGALFAPTLLGGPGGTSPASGPAQAGPVPAAGSILTGDRAAAAGLTGSPGPAPTTLPAPTTPAPLPTRSDLTTPMPALEGDVLRLANAARADHRCDPLRMEPHLLVAARLHSADMAQNGYFSHDSRDGRDPAQRMRAAGYDTGGGWAENIAAGYPTPQAVMAGWMGSSGHRANILNCDLKAVGIGVARAGNGWLYWTQDFGGR